MKTFAKACVVLLLSFIVFTGCATQQGAQTVDANYAAYLANQKPTVSVGVTDDGKIESFNVYEKTEAFKPTPHPAWGFATTFIKVAGKVVGIGLVTDGVVDLAKTIKDGNGGDTYINSGNTAGGDYQMETDMTGVLNDTKVTGDIGESGVLGVQDNTNKSTDNSVTDDNSVTN